MKRLPPPAFMLFALLALPVLAAEIPETGENCPATKADSRPASETDHEAAVQANPVDPAGNSRRAVNDSNVLGGRSRPRWQSFLPGMIR